MRSHGLLVPVIYSTEFPIGGNFQHAQFLTEMHAKTKELGPVGGARAGCTPKTHQ